MPQQAKAKIGVLGASGYTGAELVRLLLRHPRVEIALLTADRRAGQEMRDVFPQFAPYALPKLRLDRRHRLGRRRARSRLLRAAARHDAEGDQGSAGEGAGDQGRRSVGRLPARRYRRLCALVRPRASRAGVAEGGGLRPDRNLSARGQEGAARRQSRLLHDLRAACRSFRSCKAKAIDPDEIVIDAKSGMTGAGRAAKEEMLFSEVSEGFHAYGVGHHRHMAELDQEFSKAAGREVVVSFTPHLVPMNRGILSTIYVRGSAADAAGTARDPCRRPTRRSRSCTCCRSAQMPQTRHVRGSNMTFIGVAEDRIPGRAIIVLGARQSGEGRVGPGGAEHEPDARLSGDDWASSRWRCFREGTPISTRDLHVAARRVLDRLELAAAGLARLHASRRPAP